MQRFKYAILAAAGILLLAFVLSVIGPKRVMAALGYTPVRDVDNPALQPFQQAVNFNAPGSDSVAEATLAVPSNKRLVVEYISALDYSPDPWTLTIGDPGLPEPVIFMSIQQVLAPTVFDSYGGGQEVRYYADPGSVLHIHAYRNYDIGRSFYGKVTVIGHLVSIP